MAIVVGEMLLRGSEASQNDFTICPDSNFGEPHQTTNQKSFAVNLGNGLDNLSCPIFPNRPWYGLSSRSRTHENREKAADDWVFV